LPSALFQQFLNERRYLKNVTPDTIEWYETAFKAFERTLHDDAPVITKTSLQNFVVKMPQRNVKAVSVNTYIKALNAFCRWLHEEGHYADRLELPLLKLEKRVLPTLTDERMTTLLARRPKGFVACRLHAVIAFVLDTGERMHRELKRETARPGALDNSRYVPSAISSCVLAAFSRIAIKGLYSGELYQRSACSRLGNSSMSRWRGCQSPSLAFTLPPRTTNLPPYCSTVAPMRLRYSWNAAGSVTSMSPITYAAIFILSCFSPSCRFSRSATDLRPQPA
jgi:integrase family protein with SAM-like domain